jgi:hypothetical protein
MVIFYYWVFFLYFNLQSTIFTIYFTKYPIVSYEFDNTSSILEPNESIIKTGLHIILTTDEMIYVLEF